MHIRNLLALSASTLLIAACSQSNDAGSRGDGQARASAKPPQLSAPPPAVQAGVAPNLTMAVVNAAVFTGGGDAADGSAATGNTTGEGGAPKSGGKTADTALIRAEVLLDRANYKPGVIDGRMGENVADAISAYAKAHDLPDTREITPQVWQALASADGAPVLKAYTITAEDVAGPWTPDVGEDFVKLSQQKSAGYASPQEMLAERFHMDEGLLKSLNPQVDFAKAGAVIAVVDPGPSTLSGKVARLEVDKATKSVIAYGDDDKEMAFFPATVGSTERPSPHGTWKVKGVAQNPDYLYDPSKLTWGPKRAGKLHIPPGPNNPVGIVWIALTAPDYGIHGTPDPHLIGKSASHGCVRLTNWDAEELSKAVKPGVKVDFVSSDD